jgi:uncharacterized protein (TIGR02452 family)
MNISRARAAQLGRETVAILGDGHYTTPTGVRVEIADLLREAVEGTISYPPDAPLPPAPVGDRGTSFEVTNETTLSTARRLTNGGFHVVALNFASARHPGGGFLGGARAQEESLCRASGLYACIRGSPMYTAHAGHRGGFYTNYAIYSPNVPVLRDDESELLPEPYLCSFVTAPAVNVGAARDVSHLAVRQEMERRVEKILSIAAGHGHDAAVLGAWGCGVFKNDPELIAELFHQALTRRFRGAFSRVAFAVLDWSADRYFIGPFQRRFGDGGASPG